MRSKEKGLSLLELLVTIALIAIVISFSTSIMDTYSRSIISRTRDDILSALERARHLSITSVPHGVSFYPEGDKYYFKLIGLKDGTCSDNSNPCYNDDDCNNGKTCKVGNLVKDPDESNKPIETRALPSGYSIEVYCQEKRSSSSELWFDRKGVPRNSDWKIFCTDEDDDNNSIDIEIKLKGKSFEETLIKISPAGRIKYEK